MQWRNDAVSGTGIHFIAELMQAGVLAPARITFLSSRFMIFRPWGLAPESKAKPLAEFIICFHSTQINAKSETLYYILLANAQGKSISEFM